MYSMYWFMYTISGVESMLQWGPLQPKSKSEFTASKDDLYDQLEDLVKGEQQAKQRIRQLKEVAKESESSGKVQNQGY